MLTAGETAVTPLVGVAADSSIGEAGSATSYEFVRICA
jgi:hypothetical protein